MKAKIILFTVLVFIMASAAAADCIVRDTTLPNNDCSDNNEIPVFSISDAQTNAHAAQNQAFYNYTVCCPQDFTGTECSNPTADEFLYLSDTDNAHAESPDFGGTYPIQLCLEAENDVSCRHTINDCDPLLGEVGIVSIWDGVAAAAPVSNAHVEQYNGIGNYPINVCCAVAVEGDVWAVEVSTDKGAYYLDNTPLDNIIANVTITNNSNSAKTAELTVKLVDSRGNTVFTENASVPVDGGTATPPKPYPTVGTWDVTTPQLATGTYSVIASVKAFDDPVLGKELVLGNNTSSAFITVINTPMQVSVPELPIFAIPIIAAGVLLVITLAGKAKVKHGE